MKNTPKEYALPFQEIILNPTDRAKEIQNNPNPIILLLDGLDDPRNLGAIFRLADATRIQEIYGFKMRAPSKPDKLERVARQTTAHILYKELETLDEVLAITKTHLPIALEYTNKSVPFNTFKNGEPCMLIIGNEKSGVSGELLEICKASLHIPMLGQNSSMNVSVATGIALYQILGNMKKI